MDWPEGDEEGCFRLADACVTAAHEVVAGTWADLPRSADKIGQAWDGAAHEAFAEHVTRVAGGQVADLVNRLIGAAVRLNNVGVQIQYARYMIEATVWLLIVQVGYLLAMAVASGGASLAFIPARVQLARLMVRQIVRRALANMVLFAAIVGGMEGGVQALQIARGRRDDFDERQLLISAVTGGAMGALMGGLSGGLTHLATPALQAGLSRAEMSVAEKLLAAATSSLYGQAAQYALTGGITTAGSMIISGDFDWDLLAKAVTSSALGADGQHFTTTLPHGSPPPPGSSPPPGSPPPGGPPPGSAPHGGAPPGGSTPGGGPSPFAHPAPPAPDAPPGPGPLPGLEPSRVSEPPRRDPEPSRDSEPPGDSEPPRRGFDPLTGTARDTTLSNATTPEATSFSSAAHDGPHPDRPHHDGPASTGDPVSLSRAADAPRDLPAAAPPARADGDAPPVSHHRTSGDEAPAGRIERLLNPTAKPPATALSDSAGPPAPAHPHVPGTSGGAEPAGPDPAKGGRTTTEPAHVADVTGNPESADHNAQGIAPGGTPPQAGGATVTHAAEHPRPQAHRQPSDHARLTTSEWVRTAVEAHGTEAGNGSAPSALDYQHQRAQAVEKISTALGLSDPEALNALKVAYDVVRANHGPYIVRCVMKMLPDVKADADAGRTIVYLGRDGATMAIAARALDPEFFDRHCTMALVSRKLAESAIQDLERTGRTFPQLEKFRHFAKLVDSGDVDGAAQRLTKHLQLSGVPVGREGAVTIVDNGFRGTIQEILTAMYPETSFTGRYMFFSQSPGDPHPESKQGYEFHLGLDRSNAGSPLYDLLPPKEVELTFRSNWALYAIEETTQGPLSSPVRVHEDGHPIQALERDNPTPLHGLNPILMPGILTDPLVREAVLRINLIGVDDCARNIMALKSKGGDWQGELDRGRDRFVSNVRAWILGGRPDPEFLFMNNAFARREFGQPIMDLASAIEQAGLPRQDARRIWESFDGFTTREEKEKFVEEFKRSHPSGDAHEKK
ncbi:hypothetical protein OHA77_08525 [Streptosporangium sp. NBC_01639]|uniref:WXG100-like domain-containing protein n=1 Tax=Streptosporangium sp. NBC_01639 TaxID=2975948 RepID=UPI003870B32D|nr:hypothetical protein OHA77_08525 [Streptosporangium sp. NBC_01639]